MSTWEYWINEPIYVDKGITNILKRKQAIYLFCKDGLIPFVKQEGFSLVYDTKELTVILLRLLYGLYKGYDVKPNRTEKDVPKEFYDEYCYRLDSQEWELFWSKWGDLQDFEDGRFAYSLRFTLSEFVWTWIHLENSSTTRELMRRIEEESYGEDGFKGKEDPYLQETSRRDYSDRHW